ncbi:MAG: type II toxin-antitoxin system RelE/ParE family toxin [Candidatus Gastranaerophilales bacterium]|nr:type II toxin-antitoxin system RelE/ParE family toxin [Candidatus Gastranaerophilales bacterium]
MIKYKIILTDTAKDNLSELIPENKLKIQRSFDSIEKNGIQSVFIKSLGNKLFEIRTGRVRALYTYKEKQLIIVGIIFLKDTQKTPKEIIKKARKVLNL